MPTGLPLEEEFVRPGCNVSLACPQGPFPAGIDLIPC